MTEKHLDGLLAELAAGTLDATQVGEVEGHLASCAACAAELAALDDALIAFTLDLPPVPAPATLRARLLASAAHGRFERFADKVAELIQLGVETVRTLLDQIDDAASYEDGPAGTRIMHLPHGPALAGANVGFVRVAAGAPFPEHTHLGTEHTFVLQGAYQDSSGDVVRRGMEAVRGAGSSHAFVALPGPDLVFLVILTAGIEIAGHPPPKL